MTYTPTILRRARDQRTEGLTLLAVLGVLASALVAFSVNTPAADAAGSLRSSSTAAPARATSWPNEHNTGVPDGTRLRPYRGPCTITSTRTIKAVDATRRCDAILIRAHHVVITDSVLPRIDATAGGSASVVLARDRIKGGHWTDGTIWGYNIRARRVNATGSQHTVHCANNCRVKNSWLHGQWNPRGGSFHNNGFLSNGGSHMVLRHNRLHCTPRLNATDGGCTGDLSLFGDFDPIRHVVVDRNLFMANNSSISYCLYAGHDPGKRYGRNPSYIKVTDNVFQRGTNRKCGVYGPVTSFKARGTGNTWSGNRWDTGGVVRP